MSRKWQQRVDLGANLRVAIERIDGCERQQHERVVVGIAQRVQHGAVRLQRVHKAGLAVGAFRLGQKVIQPLQRDRAAVRDTSPFALPWRSNRSGAPAREPAAAPDDRRGRPDRADRQSRPPSSSQPSVDHSGRQWSIMRRFSFADDVGRIQRICRRSGMRFSHWVPWIISDTDEPSDTTSGRRAIDPNLGHQP